MSDIIQVTVADITAEVFEITISDTANASAHTHPLVPHTHDDTDPTTTDPGDPTVVTPVAGAAFQELGTGALINIPEGYDRKLIVAIHFEQTGQTATGVNVTYVADGNAAMTLVGTQATEGSNGLQIFTLNVPGTAAQFSTSLEVTFGSAVAVADYQIMGYVVSGVASSAQATTGTAINSDTVNAAITTVADGEIVISFVGTGDRNGPWTTTYGDDGAGIYDLSSTCNSTININSGTAGPQTITWENTVNANNSSRTVWGTVRFGALNPAAPDPEPPVGATSIYNTKIDAAATLSTAGFGTTCVHNGGTQTHVAQIETGYFIPYDTSAPAISCYYNGSRPPGGSPSLMTDKWGNNITAFKAKEGALYSLTSDNHNDLWTLVDDASGSYATSVGETPVANACIASGGTYHRPGGTGNIYGNWQHTPGNNVVAADMGTLDEAKRGGNGGGASLISAVDTVITDAEYQSAIGGNVSAIPHAINCLVWGSPYMSRTSSGYTWPAYRADGNYNENPSHTGSYNSPYSYCRMGSLLTCPTRLTATEVPFLGGSGNEVNFLKALVEAFYLYGGYISDNTAWRAYGIQIEAPESNRTMSEAMRTGLIDIYTNLQVVIGNGPTTIGGGTGPRRT